jgi:imidazolonepropionase-like amidohydrolase
MHPNKMIMKKSLSFLLLTYLMIAQSASAQTHHGDSATYVLHKFAQAIGKEVSYRKDSANSIWYDIHFHFNDRGMPVDLHAEERIDQKINPQHLFIKGGTSRFSVINDSVWIDGKTVRFKIDDSLTQYKKMADMFPVAGYSPGTVQMSLLHYWLSHNKPINIKLLPIGDAQIKKAGTDTFQVNGKPLLLDRYIIKGIVWGNEMLWLKKDHQLAALITNDAEGDKLELVESSIESILPDLLEKGALYGMQLFRESLPKQTANKAASWLRHANIADVESGTVKTDYDLVIREGIIVQMGASGSFQPTTAATIIDLTGKTIVPGLWDMHAHFEQAEWGPAYLGAGVTTVRDCGNEFVYINAIQRSIERKEGIGPTIIKAGIIDGPGPKGLGIIRASNEAEAKAAVQLYKDNGFAQIKIYSSVKPEIVKAICTEAHRLGLTVTGHIPEGMNLRQGVDSGMDQINHIQYVTQLIKKAKDGTVNWQDSSNIAVLQFLKEHKTVIDPTIGVFEMIFKSVDDDIHILEPRFEELPIASQEIFKHIGMPDKQAKLYANHFVNMKKLVKVLFDNGIPVIAGTDMGFPGWSLHRELELYVEAGLTPMEALQTATIIPARIMNLDQQTGSLAVGKQADLVILNNNPLTDIRQIRNIQNIVKGGTWYRPDDLLKIAGFNIK